MGAHETGAMDKPHTPAPIHVFRAGKHTTAAGEEITFSQTDLEASAAAYDPALHEAPLVVGHPKSDDPAYGWTGGLQVDAAGLHVLPRQVNAQFAEQVSDGAYKKVSVAWYRPTDAANPVPGVWYPRHIGFLGAVPPAIKGLHPVQFREGGEPVEIEFSEYDDVTNAGLWRRLREWIIGQLGQETADRVVPAWDVGDLERSAQDDLREAQAEPTPQFSENSPKPPFDEGGIHHQETIVTPEQAAALEAENTQLKADKAARDAADQAAAAKTRRANAVQFCEGLAQAGKLLPDEKATTITLYELAAQSAPVEFGEGDAATTEAPLAKFKALLEGLPKRVEFSEIASGKPPAADTADPTALAARAVEFQESERSAGRQISIAEAVQRVSAA